MAVLSIGTVVSVWRVMLKVKRPPEFSRAEIDRLSGIGPTSVPISPAAQSALAIRLPKELWRRIRKAAADTDVSIQEYVTSVLDKEVPRPKPEKEKPE
jgi:hypothetical protein